MSIYEYRTWSLQKLKQTAKWLITDCDRVYDALDDIEREMFIHLLDLIPDTEDDEEETDQKI
jgi:hypothetical protein